MGEQRLSGKRVLVTGGTRGIGRATVRAFAHAGADVVTCYRADPGPAAELDRELGELGGRHRVVQADVTTAQGAAALVDTADEALGGLDVLVNNVGVDGMAPLADLGPDEWTRVMDGNVTATYLVTRAALPLIADGGSVVLVGSSVATRGRPNAVHYTTAKAALGGFAKALGKEVGGRGIRVNTVSPGVVETEPGAGLPPHLVERLVHLTALGRLGRPEDVAAAVLFLAGDDAGYVTGATLTVDGGM